MLRNIDLSSCIIPLVAGGISNAAKSAEFNLSSDPAIYPRLPLSVVRLYDCRPHPCTSPIPLSKCCCRSCVWQKSSIRRKPSAGCEHGEILKSLDCKFSPCQLLSRLRIQAL